MYASVLIFFYFFFMKARCQTKLYVAKRSVSQTNPLVYRALNIAIVAPQKTIVKYSFSPPPPPFIIVPLKITNFFSISPPKPRGSLQWGRTFGQPLHLLLHSLFITDISVHTLNTPSFSESNFWCPLSICSLVIVLCISYT